MARSEGPSTSADGRYVAFRSEADNIVAGVSGMQLYVRDLQAGTTTLASRADGANGTAQAAIDTHPFGGQISANGRYASFSTDAENVISGVTSRQVYVRDLRRGRTVLASRADGPQGRPASHATFGWISATGRYVAFSASAPTLDEALVPGHYDPTGHDVYLRDLWRDRTVLVSREDGPTGPPVDSWTGSSPAGMSPGGRYVSFLANGPDVGVPGQVYLRDVRLGRTVLVSRADGPHGEPSGRVWSTLAPVLADGCRVAFSASGGGLVAGVESTGTQAYVRDLCKHTTRLVSQADGPAGGPAMSPPFTETWGLDTYVYVLAQSTDGRYVAFQTRSPNFANLAPTNLVEHVYVRDVVAGRTILVSRASGTAGAPADTPANLVPPLSMSANGERVAFASAAAHLLPPGQSAGDGQVFVRELGAQPTGQPVDGALDDPGLGSADRPPWAAEPENPLDAEIPVSPPGDDPPSRPAPPAHDGPTFVVPRRAGARLSKLRISGRRVRLNVTRTARLELTVARRVPASRHRPTRWRNVARRAFRADGAGMVAVSLPRLRPGRYRVAVAVVGRPASRVTRRLTVPRR